MDSVLIINVDTVVDISKYKYYTFRILFRRMHHGMKPLRLLCQILMRLYIFQQI